MYNALVVFHMLCIVVTIWRILQFSADRKTRSEILTFLDTLCYIRLFNVILIMAKTAYYVPHLVIYSDFCLFKVKNHSRNENVATKTG